MVGFRPEMFLPADFSWETPRRSSVPVRGDLVLEYLGAERLVCGNVGEKSHALHVVSRLPGT